MTKTPQLARIEKGNELLTVEGGLHFMRGNSVPYFTITGTLKENRQSSSCGAIHEDIERLAPGQFSDLIALHLSDIDGTPMYAVDNGFYHAGGCGREEFTEAGHKRAALERACGDNIAAVNAAMKELGLENAPLRKGVRYEDTGRPEVLARYLRIASATAGLICDEVKAGRYTKEMMKAFCDTLRPQWKAEAEACIKKHGLVVFGDSWKKEG